MQSIKVASKLELIKGSAMNAAAVTVHHETQWISKNYPTLKKGAQSVCVSSSNRDMPSGSAWGQLGRSNATEPRAHGGVQALVIFKKLAVWYHTKLSEWFYT